MIAVSGATGNVGGKVADLLLNGGEAVRVFGRSAERLGPLRRQGAEVLAGDAVNLDDLQELFRDAAGALVVLPDNVTDSNYVTNRSKMSQAIAQALRDQRVSYVVMASSLGAERERGGGPLNTLHELEALLFELESTSVLINRAALHMEQNLLPAIPMIQEQGMYGTALRGDLRIPLIATIDIAERAAGHLLHRDFSGHDVEMVLGPKDVTMEEATHVLGDALGIPDARYVQFLPKRRRRPFRASACPRSTRRSWWK